jgi:hypothetical protein
MSATFLNPVKLRLSLLAAGAVLAGITARATVDDALSFALEAMTPYIKDGYTIREDTWGGDLPVATAKAISQQLFKGNDYWFTMGTDIKGSTISVHIYDRDGNLVENSAWQRDSFAGASIKPTKTGSYFLIVKVEKSPRERTPWGLVYAYR